MILNNINIGERLNELRLYLKFSQKELANLLVIHQTAISDIEKGKTNPSYNILKGLLQNIDELNIDWFLTGRGSMFHSDVAGDRDYVEAESHHSVAAHPESVYVVPSRICTDVSVLKSLRELHDGMEELINEVRLLKDASRAK